MEYLAFDFGDGTVCAARYKTAWAEGQTVMEPEILHIMRGSKEVWSTLARNFETNNYEVGVNKPRRGFELQLNWKSKPSKRDEGWELRRKHTVLFMERVFELFLNSNPDYDTDGNGKWLGTYRGKPCKIAIGVPCDWSDATSVKSGAVNDIDEYKKMAKEAGLGDVHVFKEAQAAVLYARRFMGDGLPDEYIEKGTLLVDIGSSTTDFTYLKGNKASNMGLTLGAKYVEQSFLGDAMRNAGYEYYAKDADLETKKTAVSVRNWNLLEVRGYKEDFFSAVDQARVTNSVAEIPTSPLSGTKLQLGSRNDEGYITEPYVDSCLDGADGVMISLPHLSEKWSKTSLDKKNTWRGHFREALFHLQKQWEIDNREVTVVVTGGASRMQFVKDDVRRVFGENVRYRAGDSGQQSFSVVKGLAWASYVTDLIGNVRKGLQCKIEEYISSGDFKSTMDGFFKSVTDDIADKIVTDLRNQLIVYPHEINTYQKIKLCSENCVRRAIEGYQLEKKIQKLIEDLLDSQLPIFADLHNKLGRANISQGLRLEVKEKPCLRYNLNLNFDLNVDNIFEILFNFLVLLPMCVTSILTLGLIDVDAWVVRYANRPWSRDKVIKLAGKIRNQKEDVARQLQSRLFGDQRSFEEKVASHLKDVFLKVKMQELNALEGLANYRD